jgi:hypothetical protein
MITALDSFLLQSQHDVSDSPVIIVITCVIIGSVVVSIILIFILVSVFILSVISVVILVILVSVIIVILVSVIIVVSIILILVSVVSIILIVILISVVRKEIKPVIVLGDVTRSSSSAQTNSTGMAASAGGSLGHKSWAVFSRSMVKSLKNWTSDFFGPTIFLILLPPPACLATTVPTSKGLGFLVAIVEKSYCFRRFSKKYSGNNNQPKGFTKL